MIKILISFTIFLGLGLSAADVYNENMDKKVYYDANRDHNEVLKEMSEVLEGFITSEVNETIVQNYKNGKLQLSQEELELQKQNGGQNIKNNLNSVKQTKVGFFDNMLSKIGLGGSEKKKDIVQKEPIKEEPGFFTKMLEKVGIGSTKKLPVDEKSVTNQEVPNENQ